MKQVYITNSCLANGENERLAMHPSTIAAAKRGVVTDALRRAMRAAQGEEVILVDLRQPHE